MQLDPPTEILTAAARASGAAAAKASSATAASSPASARRGRIVQPAITDFADIISSQDSLWRRITALPPDDTIPALGSRTESWPLQAKGTRRPGRPEFTPRV